VVKSNIEVFPCDWLVILWRIACMCVSGALILLCASYTDQ
jgi:hypothetical protein